MHSHIHEPTNTQTSIHTCTHAQKQAYTHAHTQNKHTHKHTQKAYTHAHKHAQTHMYIHAHTESTCTHRSHRKTGIHICSHATHKHWFGCEVSHRLACLNTLFPGGVLSGDILGPLGNRVWLEESGSWEDSPHVTAWLHFGPSSLLADPERRASGPTLLPSWTGAPAAIFPHRETASRTDLPWTASVRSFVSNRNPRTTAL